MKLFALLALSIATMNATPAAFGIVANQSYKAASSSSDDVFYQLKNGDYSKEGYGSVTSELEDYGIENLNLYNAGLVTQSCGLMFSETEENVYFYTYDTNARTNYNQISIAFDVSVSGSVDLELNPDFRVYNIELVSRSSNFYLCKWKINGFTPNLDSNHIYYARELFSDNNDILPCVMTYQYDAVNKLSVCQYKTYVDITSKKVAWQNIPGASDSDINTFTQYHYVVFSTSIDDVMDNLAKIELEYKAYKFGGLSTLRASESSFGVPVSSVNDVTNANYINAFNKSGDQYSQEYLNNGDYIKKTIEPETIVHDYTSTVWFQKYNYEWEFKTIDKVSNLDGDLWSNSEINQYTWFVNFASNEVGFGLINHMSGTIATQADDSRYFFGQNDPYKLTRNGWGNNYNSADEFVSAELQNLLNEEQMPVNVEDLSILRLWYEEDGAIKEAIVVDTYTDSNGTDNIWDPSVTDFATWLSNIKNWWNQNWRIVVAIIAAIVLLPIIIAFFPAVITVLKTIITLPFKLIKWLFSPSKK